MNQMGECILAVPGNHKKQNFFLLNLQGKIKSYVSLIFINFLIRNDLSEVLLQIYLRKAEKNRP